MTVAGVTSHPYEIAAAAAAEVTRWAGGPPHEVAIVLGSGWQGVADGLGTAEAERATTDLPGFAAPTVAGHHGQLRSLKMGGHRVLLLIGRTHLYEGRSPAEVVHPVRTAVIAGAHVVILTNAAGGLDPAMRPGQAVLIRDHLNLMGASPLGGPPPPRVTGDASSISPSSTRPGCGRWPNRSTPAWQKASTRLWVVPITRRPPRWPCSARPVQTSSGCRRRSRP